MAETAEEFRERMRSVGFVGARRFKKMEKIITRPDSDPSGNQIDSGRKAKMILSEDHSVVLTTSDNRQDVNVFGTAATSGGAGGNGEDD